MIVLVMIAAVMALTGDQTVARPVAATGPLVTVEKPRCRSAREAVPYYRAKTWEWQTKRSFGWSKPSLADVTPSVRGKTCRWARYAADVWVTRATAARKSYERWYAYHYDWQKWLPSRWYAIGSCETGYGGDPNWEHHNSEFEGAFGNRGPGRASGAWLGHIGRADPKAGPYPTYAYMATPRQQYEHALVLYSLYGWDPWGCA